jgi:hypothetical protein
VIRVGLTGFLVALLLSACSGGIDESHLSGYWRLDVIAVDGVATPVEPGVNTRGPAWILIGDIVEGSAGCNDFRNTIDRPWSLESGRMLPGEVMFTAMACGYGGRTEPLEATERILQSFLWGAADAGFAVSVNGDSMVWSLGATRLQFSRTDGPVYLPPPPPETGIGPLECSPGILIREQVPDTGIDGEQILRSAVPEVVEVFTTQEDWSWYGRETAGAVIAAVYRNDIVPVTFTLFTCANRR